MEPAAALHLVREELRSCVLPRLAADDDYGRSVLVAAVGVLGELAARTVEDDAWSREPTRRLAAAVADWRDRLGVTEDLELSEDDRRNVLGACDVIAADLWREPPAAAAVNLRSEILAVLSADVAAELDRTSRNPT